MASTHKPVVNTQHSLPEAELHTQLIQICFLVCASVDPADCWAIQAGLLTPLTFARHRLSPLAAFTSSAYFLHNGRR